MEPQYLIDTNIVIDYLGRKLPDAGMIFIGKILDRVPIISVITKIEVLGFNAPAEYNKLLESFIADITVVDLTSEIVYQTITIRKSYKIKLPDAIIAATALVNNLTLITRNTADFKIILGLNLLNPHNFFKID